MKKSLKLISILGIAFAVTFLSGCGNIKEAVTSVSAVESMSAEESLKFLSDNAFDFAAKAEKDIKSSKDADVKKLGDYKTKYNVSRNNLAAAIAALTKALNKSIPVNKKDADLPFEVIEWGPQGIVPGNISNPEFYVIFSQPVKALEALGSPSENPDVFTITPPVKGKFRWTGTKQLNFIASEQLNPSQVYTISVNENLKSLAGASISGDLSFDTKAQPLYIHSIYPGYNLEEYFYYNSDAGVPMNKAKFFIVSLNSKISVEEFNEKVFVSVEKDGLSFEAVPIEKSKDTGNTSLYKKCSGESSYYFVTIKDKLEPNTEISVTAENEKSYFTLRPIKVHGYYSGYNNSYSLNFNQPVEKTTVLKNISTEPEVKLSAENVVISGTNVYLRNIPFEYETKYTLNLKSGIKDIYGQIFEGTSLEFQVPRAASYMKTIDSGAVIMEAQFPHKFIIEHQNLINGGYWIRGKTSPLKTIDKRSFTDSEFKALSVEKDNIRHFEEIELDPYLEHGLGVVSLGFSGTATYYDSWDKVYREYDPYISGVTIQVTDLGVTARAGFNKVVALVRKLSDDTPVKNAEVYLFNGYGAGSEWFSRAENSYLGKGKTDADGFVEFDVDESKFEYEVTHNYFYLNLAVKKDNDKVCIPLSAHSPWRAGVHSTSPEYAIRRENDLVFMFTDRGIYRPGETVSFRGIARKLRKYNLEVPNGKVDVRLEKLSWGEQEVYGTVTDVLTENGGFAGKFDLREDLEPGTYVLSCYKDSKTIGFEYFTVAFFEKLKIQANASIPDVVTYLGDSLSAELNASYLAGGSLSGGSYNASWYKQAVDFSPSTPESEGYVFGPENVYHSPDFISEVNGKISEDGVTRIPCTTVQGILGQPYLYNVEIGVTDISNQRIFTGASKLVHSSAFYIGSRKRFTNGYPKTNTKLDVPFALFNTDGTLASPSVVSDKIEYTISRSYWSYVTQDSVDGLYSNWERLTEEVTSGKIDPKTKGEISFTPAKSGYYTVSFLAKDKKNNSVKTDNSFYVIGADYYWYDRSDSSSLRLTPDRDSYMPGDTAKLLLESPLPSGDYVITVEKDKILSSELRHIDAPCAELEIPVKAEYLPVAYVSICSYSTRKGPPTHEYGEPDFDKPKGYYGVCELKIDYEVASFKVDVTKSKNIWRPGEEITLNIKATKAGNPVKNAELTLMVVDRAVTDLINYHVSNPVSYFYNRSEFPLGVAGGDSRAYLMDPVTYKIKSLQGGDSDEDEKDNVRKDFRPTAFFEPVIKTDDNGEAFVKFKLPDNLTTYRVTAVGISKNNFALHESEVQVQNLVNVQSVQPRRLRIRDTAEAGVIVTNLDTVEKTVNIEVSVRGPITEYEKNYLKGLKTTTGDAFIDGVTSKSVKVPAGKTLPVYFNVAATAAGNIELVYNVSTQGFKEKLISKILIEKPFVYETVTTKGTVESSSFTKNEMVSGSEYLILPSWADEGNGSLEITLDPTNIGLLGSSVRYVFNYPYGCLEQQSSRIWPLISFAEYIDVFGLKTEVEDPRKVILEWFKSIKNEQGENGGFPYWPGSVKINEFVSTRILHIAKLALEHGYSKSEIGFDIDELQKYCSSKINEKNFTPYSAYNCYVLALYKDKNINDKLNELYEYILNPENRPSLTTVAYTALAYEYLGGNESKKRAKKLAELIRSHIKFNVRSAEISGFGEFNRYYGYMYDSYDEGLAATIQLFVKQKPNDTAVDKLLFALIHNQKGEYWQSTATTAKIFETMYVLIKERKLDALDFVGTAVLKMEGGTEHKLAQSSFKGAGAKAFVRNLSFTGGDLKTLPRNKPMELEFTKDGKGTLYYTAQLRYAIPSELYEARDEGFELSYRITDENGNQVMPVSKDSSVIVLEAGKVYTVEAGYTTTQTRRFVATRIPVPSGVEIVDTSLSTGASKNTDNDTGYERTRSDYYDYDDWDYYNDYYAETYEYFYDNEAQFFNNYNYAGTTVHKVKIRASRKGVYPTPPVQTECMYEPEVFGRANGYLFIIK